jgi:hypothetical protein
MRAGRSKGVETEKSLIASPKKDPPSAYAHATPPIDLADGVFLDSSPAQFSEVIELHPHDPPSAGFKKKSLRSEQNGDNLSTVEIALPPQ